VDSRWTLAFFVQYKESFLSIAGLFNPCVIPNLCHLQYGTDKDKFLKSGFAIKDLVWFLDSYSPRYGNLKLAQIETWMIWILGSTFLLFKGCNIRKENFE
jgi:hypothetical protein